MLSAYDLTYHYFVNHRPDGMPASDENKKKVLQRINELLDKGWTETELMHYWRDRSAQQPKGGNLLQSDAFYWHNQLRLIPGPSKMHFDIDAGVIVKDQEPWFLEMRSSYTMDDVLDHYLKQFSLARSEVNVNKYLGTFKYLLSRHDLDLLLFMIDASANYSRDGDQGAPLDPIRITDFERQAQDALNRKITETRNAGGERIVPRTRIPLD